MAKFIQSQSYPWIVSYDNHPLIPQVFSHQKIIPIFFDYTVKEYRKAKELLITNIKTLTPMYKDEIEMIVAKSEPPDMDIAIQGSKGDLGTGRGGRW